MRAILLMMVVGLASAHAQSTESPEERIRREVLRFYEEVPEYRAEETPELNQLLRRHMEAKGLPFTAESMKQSYAAIRAERMPCTRPMPSPPYRAVKIYVFTEESARGFVDAALQRRRDSVLDLRKEIARRRIEVVNAEEDSDITLEVTISAEVATGIIRTRIGQVGFDKMLGQISVSTTEEVLPALATQLRVRCADYSIPIVAQGGFAQRDHYSASRCAAFVPLCRNTGSIPSSNIS